MRLIGIAQASESAPKTQNCSAADVARKYNFRDTGGPQSTEEQSCAGHVWRIGGPRYAQAGYSRAANRPAPMWQARGDFIHASRYVTASCTTTPSASRLRQPYNHVAVAFTRPAHSAERFTYSLSSHSLTPPRPSVCAGNESAPSGSVARMAAYSSAGDLARPTTYWRYDRPAYGRKAPIHLQHRGGPLAGIKVSLDRL
jgi:hypothetical protein